MNGGFRQCRIPSLGPKSDEGRQSERRNPSLGTTSAESTRRPTGSRNDRLALNPLRSFQPSQRHWNSRQNPRTVGARKHPAVTGSGRVSDLADERPRESRIRNSLGRARSDVPRHRVGQQHRSFRGHRRHAQRGNPLPWRGDHDHVTNCSDHFDPIVPLPYLHITHTSHTSHTRSHTHTHAAVSLSRRIASRLIPN